MNNDTKTPISSANGNSSPRQPLKPIGAILGKVLDFLFGKDPDIFDENGNVLHRHPKKKWDAWQNRYRTESQYNWRQHTGMGSSGKTKN